MKNLFLNNININLNKNKSGFINKKTSKKNNKLLKKMFFLNIITNVDAKNIKFSLFKHNKKIKKVDDNFNK